MDSLNMSKLNLYSAKSIRRLSSGKHCNDLYWPEDELEKRVMSEYDQDIWNSLIEAESEKPTIVLQSPQLQFRGALVCELRRYVKKLGLSYGTLHTAVYLLDLFMNSHDLRSDRLTDVAVVCLSLAAKSEERNNKTPCQKSLRNLIGRDISGFGSLEYAVANHAKWRLTAPTAASIATLVATMAQSSPDDELLRRILDLTLSDVRLSIAPASRIGCACVAATRVRRGLCAWPPPLQKITKIGLDNVSPIADFLLRMLHATEASDNVGVGRVSPNVDHGYFSNKNTPESSPCTQETQKSGQNVHTLVPTNKYLTFQSRPVSDINQYHYRIIKNCRKEGNVTLRVPIRLVTYAKPSEILSENNHFSYRSQRLVDAALVSEGNCLKRRAVDLNTFASKRICKPVNFTVDGCV